MKSTQAITDSNLIFKATKSSFSKKTSWVIGIDEAGRGPLAGPIALGFVAIKKTLYLRHKKTFLKGIKDSKQLTEKEREAWFLRMRRYEYASIMIHNEHIDRNGLTASLVKAIKQGLKKLGKKSEECQVLLDGLLHAPKEYIFQETIIKGDERVPVIAAASIVAKVTRDRYMVRLSKKFPEYGFHKHKGYGTKHHYAMLAKYGPCKIHRLSFLGTQ